MGKVKKTDGITPAPADNLPVPGQNLDIEELQADSTFGFKSGWIFPNGCPPGPKLMPRVKRMVKAKAIAIPWFAEKAEELGLDPETTDILSVYALALVQAAIENPSSQASIQFLNRIAGASKSQLEIGTLGMLKNQLPLEDLSEEVLDAIIAQSRTIEGRVDGKTDKDNNRE